MSEWVNYIHNTRQSYLNPVKLSPLAMIRLTKFHHIFCTEKPGSKGLRFIADERQTSFMMPQKKRGESAIFFDVGHSLIVKSIYSALCGADAQSDVFKTCLSAATLSLTKKDGLFANLLGDCQTLKIDDLGIVSDTDMADVSGSIDVYKGKEWQTLFGYILDASIIAHEAYHELVFHSERDDNCRATVDHNYPSFVSVVSDTAGPFQNPGPEDEMLKYQNEVTLRSDYYESRIESIKEELECDLFALLGCYNVIKPIKNYERSSDWIFDLMSVFFLTFCVYQLHEGILYRARARFDDLQEGQIAAGPGLFNLRRVAIGAIAGSIYGGSVAEESNEDEAQASERLQSFLNRMYIDLTASVLEPVVVRMNESFRLVDKEYPKEKRREARGITEASQRLSVSGFPYRMDSEIASGMFSDEVCAKLVRF